MTRLLIALGVIFILAGLLWPWLQKLPLGRLPGDIVINREQFRFYFPITTSIIISIVLTVIFWLFKK